MFDKFILTDNIDRVKFSKNFAMKFRYKYVIISMEVVTMKERYVLNPLSQRILHTGMIICIMAYFFVMLDVHHTVNNSVIIQSNVYTMMEHVSLTLLLVVAAALLLDIHIKHEK